MKALAVLFTDEADFVNVGARHWKGRNEIQAEHAARLGQFRESVWTTKGVTVQFLECDIAIVHITWSMRSDKDPVVKALGPRWRRRKDPYGWSTLSDPPALLAFAPAQAMFISP